MPQPRVFIGSSKEGHHLAELLQLGLDSHAECTIWSQGVFGLSGGTLESLCDSAKSFDFAILVLTPDDLVQKRSHAKHVPRDNVLFELGLFMGSLGRDSTFIVHCSEDRIELPSDLAGVATVQWRSRSDGNLRAAIGPACTTIRLAMDTKKVGPVRGADGELVALRSMIEAQSRDIRSLVESLKRDAAPGPRPLAGNRTPEALAFLEGTWRNPVLDSFYYPRLLDGVLRCPYCYGGNNSLTGEFHDIVRTGDILTGKFRWFIDKVTGCFYLRINTPDELVGGWWYDKDLDVQKLRQHPISGADSMDIRSMVPHRMVRDQRVVAPQWALDYYEAVRKATPGTA